MIDPTQFLITQERLVGFLREQLAWCESSLRSKPTDTWAPFLMVLYKAASGKDQETKLAACALMEFNGPENKRDSLLAARPEIL